MQGFVISYQPKLIDGLSLGFIRWVQMYSALVEGKYWWMNGSISYFPAFKNLFRKNDEYENIEAQTDQAAGNIYEMVMGKILKLNSMLNFIIMIPGKILEI